MNVATAAESLVLRTRFPKALNASLWTTQMIAAATLGRAGLTLLTEPLTEVAGRLGDWVPAMSMSSTHMLGIIVLVGAFAIVAPSFARIVPKLAGFAAAGLALLLAISSGVHGFRGEIRPFLVDVALVAMLLFIAWGRTYASPIEAHAHIRC